MGSGAGKRAPQTNTPPPCRFGAACYNHDPEHRAKFSHPPTASTRHRACRYGLKCKDTSARHLREFVHPGDNHYRSGLVVFPPSHQGPEFETLWQLFNYFDPEETGHLDRSEFADALNSCLGFPDEVVVEQAWQDVDGEANSAVNFARFAVWAEAFPVDLPVGLDIAGGGRPCHCRLKTAGGEQFSCGCTNYIPGPDGFLCDCGHKPSMHRCNATTEAQASMMVQLQWTSEGLAEVGDPDVLQGLQEMLDSTHKKTKNWTRDRGCSLHGVNGSGCSLECAFQNRVQVPTGYLLRRAYRNQNSALWRQYSITRSAIAQECAASSAPAGPDLQVLSCAKLDVPLDDTCNEWRVFHGCSLEAGRLICNFNFRSALAGTGATWKTPGEDKGMPLYGFGFYCAERITKADEYATPKMDPDTDAKLCTALVVRCVGGRANVITTNDIETEKLRNDIFDGPYHSVCGDRMQSLGKPYREFVIYDKDQCFPEFLLMYERMY